MDKGPPRISPHAHCASVHLRSVFYVLRTCTYASRSCVRARSDSTREVIAHCPLSMVIKHGIVWIWASPSLIIVVRRSCFVVRTRIALRSFPSSSLISYFLFPDPRDPRPFPDFPANKQCNARSEHPRLRVRSLRTCIQYTGGDGDMARPRHAHHTGTYHSTESQRRAFILRRSQFASHISQLTIHSSQLTPIHSQAYPGPRSTSHDPRRLHRVTHRTRACVPLSPRHRISLAEYHSLAHWSTVSFKLSTYQSRPVLASWLLIMKRPLPPWTLRPQRSRRGISQELSVT